MRDRMRSAALRRWAMQCGAEADDPRIGGIERECLLKMRTGLLELASLQDRLESQVLRRTG